MSSDAAAAKDASLIALVEMLFDGPPVSSSSWRSARDSSATSSFPARVWLPSDVFLDLGCGNGSVACALTSYLQLPGGHEGLDINGDSVKWLREHYAGRPGGGLQGRRGAHAHVG